MKGKIFYRWILVLVVLYFLCKILFWGSGSFYSRFASSRRLKSLQGVEERLNQKNKILKKKLDEVNSQGVELEKMAREEYGMQKEGEVIIKFVQEEEQNE